MTATRAIQLTRGAVAIVDLEDYDMLVAMGSWYLSDTGYAQRRYNGITYRMHRVVNNTPVGLLTDHKNHNRLDNRRSNLRTVTQKQNMVNSFGKGYTWDKAKDAYMVRYRKKFYGYFKTEIEAQVGYKLASSGVPNIKAVARNRYLPKGVYYMKSTKKYYVRPQRNNEKTFLGFYNNIADAKHAYDDFISKELDYLGN